MWDAPCTKERSPIPELPEVETVRRELEPWLTGRRILSAALIDAQPGPKYANLKHAEGQQIVRVDRRGKFLLLPLASPDPQRDGTERDVLVIHLGMTGVVTHVQPAAHERVRLTLDGRDKTTLHFQDVRRFGRFLLLEEGNPATLPTLAAMGPEPLADDFTTEALWRGVRGREAAIKTLLLSQRPVAGVGNIYADEALWRVGIHPRRPARQLTKKQVVHLHGAIRDVLQASIEAQGTTLYDYRTVNGEVGAYLEKLDAYGHEGEPCRRCGTTIERIVVGQRSSHVCPTCQRPPRAPRKQRPTRR